MLQSRPLLMIITSRKEFFILRHRFYQSYFCRTHLILRSSRHNIPHIIGQHIGSRLYKMQWHPDTSWTNLPRHNCPHLHTATPRRYFHQITVMNIPFSSIARMQFYKRF